MNPIVVSMIAKAEDCLESAEYNLKGDFLAATANRAYYAVFDAVMALLYVKNIYPKSHNGAKVKFCELYILTEILPDRANELLTDCYSKRQTGDYDFNVEISYEEAEQTLQNAVEFVEMAKKYLFIEGFIV